MEVRLADSLGTVIDTYLRCQRGLDEMELQLYSERLANGLDWSVSIVNAQSEAYFQEEAFKAGIPCFYPQTMTTAPKRAANGPRKRHMRATFPGYVFTRLNLMRPQVERLRRIRGFQRLMIISGDIFVMTSQEVAKLEGLQRSGFFNREYMPTFGEELLRYFPVGSIVRLIGGKYNSYLGIMKQAPDKKGELAVVDVLGKPVMVNPLDITSQVY